MVQMNPSISHGNPRQLEAGKLISWQADKELVDDRVKASTAQSLHS